MKVGNKETLDQVDEILSRAEMESRAHESVKAIDNGDVVTLKEFADKNKDWLRKRTSK